MEILIFVALLVIFILVISIKSSIKENAERQKNNLIIISNQIKELKNKIEFVQAPIKESKEDADAIAQKIKADKEAQEKIALAEYKLKIVAIEAANEEREKERLKKEKELLPLLPIDKTAEQSPVVARYAYAEEPATQKPIVDKESWVDRWIKNNPDIEKFIGENLFNKIGIAILVFGIGFFVKYAIDQNWIGEYGRVAIGFLCGTILVGLAHYLRNSYRSFSSVLAGGGIAVFYFTIALAYHQYHIISQSVAFAAMVVVTIFAVVLSLLYNKIELAVIALIGGFLTPFFVSNGSGNYKTLFIYLIVLNVGMLALSYFKKWRLVNILALFFTIIIYGAWAVNTFLVKDEQTHYANGLLFGSIFYLLFVAMNMIHNIKLQQPFKAFDFSILILINATFFAAGMLILSQWHEGDYKGLFTIALAVINFGLAYYFYKSNQYDKKLLYLLIGLTLTFLSLAAPIQLKGNSITLFWSAEAVLLYWLFQRSRFIIFKYSSILVLGLMIISLIMDWSNANSNNEIFNLPIIFNNVKGIVTNIVAVISLILYYYLLKKDEEIFLPTVTNKIVCRVLLAIASIIFYATLYFGINLYFANTQSYIFANVYHRLMTNGLAVAVSFIVLPKIFKNDNVYLKVGMIAFCFLMYLINVNNISNLRLGVVAHEYKFYHLLAHWCSISLMIILIYNCINSIRSNNQTLQSQMKMFGWFFSFVIVFILSVECLQLYSVAFSGMAQQATLQSHYEKAGLTILWSVCSFIMIYLGIKHSYKPLRIIAIILFGIALLKLFILDIRNINPGGKIAAFILLGVLLLAISFMYQRLKKILIDDENK